MNQCLTSITIIECASVGVELMSSFEQKCTLSLRRGSVLGYVFFFSLANSFDRYLLQDS